MPPKKMGSGFDAPSMFLKKEKKSLTTPQLTGAQSRDIQSCLTNHRCEIPKCPYGKSQTVHHITPRAAQGKHTYLNMIGVCESHHREAERNMITPAQLRSYIKMRSPKEENCIKKVIEKINGNAKKSSKKKTPEEEWMDRFRI
ncbi:HNH endonuclease signature motif containing protein [Methanoregula formicica]|nr:HNH endonuclease signature motif containing protein [Methanoregula formicica]